MTRRTDEFEFCWTTRRRHLWQQCRRKYFYHYYGARGGHEPAAPEFIRALYVAKRALPLPAYLRRVINLAIREIFYAPLDTELEKATLSAAAFRIAEREFKQFFFGAELPKAFCDNWRDGGRPGDLFDEMCAALEKCCTQFEQGAWSRLTDTAPECRRYLESPFVLNIGELKCAIVPLILLRQAAELWLIDGSGTSDHGDEISALARFAFFNSYHIAPERVKTFIIPNDAPGTFLQVGPDADFSTVFAGIKADVNDMLGVIRPDGMIDEADFPCDVAQCDNCPFRSLCPRKN